MKAKLITGAVLAVLCLGGIAAFLIMKNAAVTDPYAQVRLDGKVIRTLPLSRDEKFTVESEHGSNTITVENGSVRISSADCPDKVCVRTGAISGGRIPIICLPHRLEIVIVSGSDTADTAVY